MISTDKSSAFRALHDSARPLALANVWDVAGARIVEAAGASAIATTSAGVAWSLGAPDGDSVSRDLVLDAVARITAAVALPVTVDIEGGYGDSPQDVAHTVARLLDSGAVGINIEDGTRGPRELAARIEAARRAAQRGGADLFVNARIDTYPLGWGDDHETRLRETLERAHLYVGAGADGIFLPGLDDADVIKEVAAAITVPLNVMAGPGMPTVNELGSLGVARVSLGSGVAQAAYTTVQRSARELYGDGGYTSLRHAIEYPELNGLFAASR
ncbi:isocitrate lyase/PEP mutase family protein [Streptomyces sp. enrichment culture]|uniref:isocitrate lyase/PEP mutase family protein n=1 Tax=Streptomyces sp. enrichment culture TaxID=1795815 RepID=UPI003F57ABFB